MKSIRGMRYAYLVESVWDRERKQPKQRTIKYLGKVDSISIEDIPEEYRSDPNILRFLNSIDRVKIKQDYRKDVEEDQRYARERKEYQILLSKDNREVIEMLSSGNIDGLMDIYKGFLKHKRKDLALVEFYEHVIIPALNEVGELWLRNELGIAIEHVCSNTVLGLIQIIEGYNANMANGDMKRGNMLICTPYGDLHSIPCKMVESIFMSKGYKVYNIAPSTPRETVIRYVQEIKPCIVVVSITLASRAKAAERLLNELLKSRSDMLIVVGGRGSSEINVHGVKKVESLRQLASLI